MDGGSWNSRGVPFHLHGGSYNEIQLPNGEQNGEVMREKTPKARSISPKKTPKEGKNL